MDLEKFKSKGEKVAPKKPAPAAPLVKQGGSLSEIQKAEREKASQDSSARLLDMALIDTEKQVRHVFDQDHIEDLASTFISSGLNQPDQPITVWERPNGRFLLAAGENRLKAQKLNYESLGDEFIAIRTTVLGPEPSTRLERQGVRLRENVLRDDLNDAELALSAAEYKNENPEATLADISGWIGFKNVSTGRSKISRALKLLEMDSDIFEAVLSEDLPLSRAIELDKDRATEKPLAETKEQVVEIGEAEAKKTEQKKPVIVKKEKKITFSISEEDAKNIAKLANAYSQISDPESEELVSSKKIGRKEFKLFLSEDLPMLLGGK